MKILIFVVIIGFCFLNNVYAYDDDGGGSSSLATNNDVIDNVLYCLYASDGASSITFSDSKFSNYSSTFIFMIMYDISTSTWSLITEFNASESGMTYKYSGSLNDYGYLSTDTTAYKTMISEYKCPNQIAISPSYYNESEDYLNSSFSYIPVCLIENNGNLSDELDECSDLFSYTDENGDYVDGSDWYDYPYNVYSRYSIIVYNETQEYLEEEFNTETNTNTEEDTNVLFGTIDCDGDGILGSPTNPGDTAYYLQLALEIMRYIAIVALIALSSVDYAKAVSSGDADALKKANKTVIKRLIYTVLLFIFPIILKVVFNITGIYGSVDPFCGIS